MRTLRDELVALEADLRAVTGVGEAPRTRARWIAEAWGELGLQADRMWWGRPLPVPGEVLLLKPGAVIPYVPFDEAVPWPARSRP